MITIPLHTHRIVMWMLETEHHGPGRGCPVRHDHLDLAGIDSKALEDLLRQPWVKWDGDNKMWAEDRDALLDWLVEHGILSEEQRMWLDAKDALALMEG